MADEDVLRNYLKKATAELQKARRQLGEARSGRRDEGDAIAVVGMSCRFPGGVRGPEDLWRLVADGTDAVTPAPDDRGWAGIGPDVRGGFVADVARFDAAFFAVDEREALAMDPQQRLLLETSWEAFEHGGIDPARVRETRVGVYTGLAHCQYAPPATADTGLPEDVAQHLASGSAASTASGRIAYALGLAGPAVTVDTACSSALVTLHLAGQALRAGDCTLALAGGVTVMATPAVLAEYARRGGLAADGRCKPFAAAADGMGFGEGVGVLLLEKLSDARRNGHRVLAVVRGSAVNQDGTTNGLTAPSGPAQERVIAQALADAGLRPDEVDAVEGHGVGSSLGDPIEAQSVLAAYGQGRADNRPLWLGSVKSNLGHTQIAAGAAGVIKMVMALRHGTLPRTLHIDRPDPKVDWDSGAVRLLTEPVDWPRGGRPRRAGISAFGFSGTNAHVILEEAPPPDAEDDPARPTADAAGGPLPWVLSARTPTALAAQAARLRERLTAGLDATPAEIGHALATTRASLPHRAVLVAESLTAFTEGLDALSRGEADATLVRNTPDAPTGRAAGGSAYVFSADAHDDRLRETAQELQSAFPVFARTWEEVRRHFPPADTAPLVQFAFEVALFRLLESFGMEPDWVSGCGVGELAAAHVGGALSLAAACELLAPREPSASPAAYEETTTPPADPGSGPRRPRIPVVDAATGRTRTAEECSVRGFAHDTSQRRTSYEEAVAHVTARGARTVFGLGPGAALHEPTGSTDRPGPRRPATEAVLRALAELYVTGVDVNWRGAYAQLATPRHVDLPTYPFEGSHYWLDGRAMSATSAERTDTPPLGARSPHPLLGTPLDLPDPTTRWYTHTLATEQPWYLGQTLLFGTPVVSPAALIEWGLAAARHDGPTGVPYTASGVSLPRVLPLPEGRRLPVQARVDTTTERPGATGFARTSEEPTTNASQDRRNTHPWTEHIRLSLTTHGTPPRPAPLDPRGFRDLRAAMEEQDVEDLYTRLARAGAEYGPDARGVKRLWRQATEALALIETGPGKGATEADHHLLHPLVLDACLLAAATLTGETDGQLRLPTAVAHLHVYDRLPSRVWCHARRHGGQSSPDDAPIDLHILTEDGERLVTVEGLTHAPQAPTDLPAAASSAWTVRREVTSLLPHAPVEARDLLVGHLLTHVPGTSETTDPRDLRLNQLGVDSLGAVRLRARLLRDFGTDLPLEVLLGPSSLTRIAEEICAQLTARSLLAPPSADDLAGADGQGVQEILTL
ncbi:type I polyketide synthase [Streptomyces sp. NPDC003032]